MITHFVAAFCMERSALNTFLVLITIYEALSSQTEASCFANHFALFDKGHLSSLRTVMDYDCNLPTRRPFVENLEPAWCTLVVTMMK